MRTLFIYDCRTGEISLSRTYPVQGTYGTLFLRADERGNGRRGERETH